MRLPISSLLVIGATGFAPSFRTGAPRTFGVHRTSASHTALSAIRCEGKSYQLEEREDSEMCTTEVFLNPDRTVRVGETDGPLFDAAAGEWNVKPDTNDFYMRLQKRFGTGQSGRDMGEFQFDVYRVYTGEMSMVGDSVAITGIMTDDQNTDKEVGYFNMIDGTDLKASYATTGQSATS